jgi:hypothetical protein
MTGMWLSFAFVALGLPSGLPLLLPTTLETPTALLSIADGRQTGSLPGEDVLILERFVGDGGSLVRGVADAIDDAARAGCTLTHDEAEHQIAIGYRLLATALVEAARDRPGASMALEVAADFALTLRRCLPFDVAERAGLTIAHDTATLASYLRSHRALDTAAATTLAGRLEGIVPAHAATLRRPTVDLGALIVAPATVLCRRHGQRQVVSAAEARELGQRYQARPPALVPVLGSRGIEGLRLRTDAFLRSCGFVDDDVVVSVNDIQATELQAYPSVAARIAAQHRAVVVVMRRGAPHVIEIDEEPSPPSPSPSPSSPSPSSPSRGAP